jgi:hypothetical protein
VTFEGLGELLDFCSAECDSGTTFKSALVESGTIECLKEMEFDVVGDNVALLELAVILFFLQTEDPLVNIDGDGGNSAADFFDDVGWLRHNWMFVGVIEFRGL